VTTYAQDLNRACRAFLRSCDREAEYLRRSSAATMGRGGDVYLPPPTPLQALALSVLAYEDPYTLPEDEPTEANLYPPPLPPAPTEPTPKTRTQRTGARFRATPETKALAVKLKRRGLSYAEIARELGMAAQTIAKWLRCPAP
jgi:DNA-directed RNA polymerase specialized sigma24 family protein